MALKYALAGMSDLVSGSDHGEKAKSVDLTGCVTPDALDAVLREKLGIDGDGDGEGESENEADVRWRFVERALQVLSALKEAVSEAEKANPAGPPVMSVRQEAEAATTMQICVVLGLIPSLVKGVGLGPEKRSKWVQLTTREPSIASSDPEEAHRRLVLVTDSLLSLLDEPRLASVVLGKQLGDLLAALVQLAHAPLMKPAEDDEAAEEKRQKGLFVMTKEKYDSLSSEQSRYQSRLTSVLDRVYQPLAVKYLLLLQTSGAAKWVQRAVGMMLSERLAARDDGVLNVMRGVLDLGGYGGDGAEATRKYEVVAGVLASPPAAASYRDADEYYARVCPQLLALLDLKDDTEAKQFHMIACHCVRAITERSLTMAKRHLLDVIMEPLLRCADASLPYGDIVSESSLEHCVSTLHRVFVVGNDPSPMFLARLEPVVLVLLELHCQVTFGVSHLKTTVKDVVERYLKFCVGSDAVAAIRALAFAELEDRAGRMRLPRRDIRFVSGDSGGVKAIAIEEGASDDDDGRRFYVADDEKAIVLVDLLQDSKDKSLAADFFIGLLRDLSDVMAAMMVEEEKDVVGGAAAAVAEAAAPLARSQSEMERRLLDFGRELDETMARLRKNLMVIRLLGLLSEDDAMQETLMKDSAQLLDFVCITVSRGAALCRHRRKRRDAKRTCKSERDLDEEEAEDDGHGSLLLEVQSLNTALTLLSLKSTQPDVTADEWRRLQEALPDLAELADTYEEQRIRLLAGKLRRLIATHGIVLEQSAVVKEQCKRMQDRTDEIHKLTENLKKQAEVATLEKEEEEWPEASSRYSQALEALVDPLLPVRGHGLIEMTKLVAEKDAEVMANIKKVVGLFKDNLEDDDTYIYLQAVNGLAASAAQSPDLVITLLTREFAQIDDRKFASGDNGSSVTKAVELRTKIGEALVRVTANLGELTPKYRNQLVNPFFGQMNHPDEMVRCSALSNLGEVCKNLGFGLGPIVQEVLSCLHDCIAFDRSIEVRRAAVLVIVLLLEGLGSDAFRVLEARLRDIWRELRRLRDTENDPALLEHVGAAIKRVDKIVNELFAPSQQRNLTKNIYVLDAPPDPFS